jgi:hypothetical protein
VEAAALGAGEAVSAGGDAGAGEVVSAGDAEAGEALAPAEGGAVEVSTLRGTYVQVGLAAGPQPARMIAADANSAAAMRRC